MALFNKSAHKIGQVHFNPVEQAIKEKYVHCGDFISASTLGVNNSSNHVVEQSLHWEKRIYVHFSSRLQLDVIVLYHNHKFLIKRKLKIQSGTESRYIKCPSKHGGSHGDLSTTNKCNKLVILLMQVSIKLLH